MWIVGAVTLSALRCISTAIGSPAAILGRTPQAEYSPSHARRAIVRRMGRGNPEGVVCGARHGRIAAAEQSPRSRATANLLKGAATVRHSYFLRLILLLAFTASVDAAGSDEDDDRRAFIAPITLLPTGQRISPTMAKGAQFQNLNPH